MRPKTVQDSWRWVPEHDGGWFVSSSYRGCPGSLFIPLEAGHIHGILFAEGSWRLCHFLGGFRDIALKSLKCDFQGNPTLKTEYRLGEGAEADFVSHENWYEVCFHGICSLSLSGTVLVSVSSLFILSHIIYVFVWTEWECGESGSFCFLLIRYSVSFCFGS